MNNPLVGLWMGSANDWSVISKAAEVLEQFFIPYETRVLFAHRTPDKFAEGAANLAQNRFRVMIGGTGGAAHLPGVLAAKS